MRPILPSLLLLAALPASAGEAAAGRITGRVVDPSGQAVAHVKIEISPGKMVVYSDGAGEYETGGLAPGRYRLTAVSEHFEPAAADATVEPGSAASAAIVFQKLRASYVQLNVIGDDPEAALREIPGSAFLVSARELDETDPADANEVLRRIPGVHVREDSGPAAMRLNAGIRGLNPDRSRTLLVLEDGLPLALAPYGEPEMYYSPPIDRMSRVEVLKGSGSIVYGPQTIGGVLNFITPDPPVEPQGSLDLTGGQRGIFTGQASYGGTRGQTGWRLNALRKQGDGWRSQYFQINDYMAKLHTPLSESHRLGLKVGFYDERSNSTYLGLTESQFRSNPDFNAVPDDLLGVRRLSGSLAHQFVLGPRAILTNTVFAYTTTRNWRRQDFDRARRTGVDYLRIVGDPSVPGDAIYLRNSSGNNNREFDVAGAESRIGVEHEAFGLRQRLEAGLRYVYEQHRDRRIDGETYTALSGVIREDETRYGGAVSGFVQNRMRITERLTVTPGIRLERYRYERHIHRQPVNGTPAAVDVRRGDDVAKPIPGVGIAWQAFEPLTLFAGVHRGFAPPRVKDAITRAGVSLELDAELSWNYEAGARLNLARGLRADATIFATEFSNQIVPAAVSGGATTTLANAGETVHRGAEFTVAADWSRLAGPRAGFWTELRETWLPAARFASGLYRGNRLPYAPVHSFGVAAGYRHRAGITIHVDGTRVGEQFGDNLETRPGTPDGTAGPLPAYWVWNLAAGKEFQRERYRLSPFVTVKNIGNEIYISSRAPLGIQPGMFRQVNAGLKLRF